MTLKHLRRLIGKHCARVYLVNPSQAAMAQAMSAGGYPVPHTRLVSVPIPDGERRLSVLFWVRDWINGGELVKLADGTKV